MLQVFLCLQLPICGSVPPCSSVIGLLPQKGVKQRERQNRILFLPIKLYPDMLTSSKKGLKKNQHSVLQNSKTSSRLFIHQYAAKDIKQAIISLHAGNCPLEELIAISEATFALISKTDMDLQLKNAFFQFERLFDFYKNLLRSGNSKMMVIKTRLTR